MMELPETAPDMKAILEQHRKVYEIRTSVGVIRLRHLRRLDADSITAVLAATVPDYLKLMQEFTALWDALRFIQQAPKAAPLSEAEQKRFAELLVWASPYLDEFAMPCFVQPEIKTREEFEALANSLEPKEWEHLQALLGALSNTVASFERRELAFLNRLKAYGIPLADGLTGADLTIDQSRALEQASELEEIAIGQIFGGD